MLLNGDASQWDRALQMPHYNARAMPAISFHTGVHLVQWARSGRFTLYDYGSAALNKCVASCVAVIGWADCCGYRGSLHLRRTPSSKSSPVVYVWWNDSHRFCKYARAG